MSQANIDLFAAKVAQDPALFNSLTSGVAAPAEFVERAVAAGQEAGMPFTPAEAEAWLAANAKASESGELSDAQLEGVAGGKGSVGDVFSGIFNGAVGGVSGGINGIIGGAIAGGIKGGR